jgi:two-component system CheB/CheR fusion protein
VKILIVDDNVDAAELLTMALELRGHETRAVHSGASAVTTFSEWRPETVLLDIGLPDLDGYEVARRLRDLDRQSEMDETRAAAGRFACHLLKPISLEKLVEALGRVDRSSASVG